MNVNTPPKSPGDTYSSLELNNRTNWLNSPSKSLGTFNPAMTFDSQGSYSDYTLSSDIIITANGIVDGNFRSVKITANGVNTIGFGAGIDEVITEFSGPLVAGDYWFYMVSINGGVHISIPEVQTVPVSPPIINSQSVENAAPNSLVVVFNEVVTATNVGYTFRVNSVNRTLSAVSGSGTNTLTFTISGAAILNTDTLDLSYSQSTGDTVNAQLFELENFTQTTVINNVGSSYTFANTHEMVVDALGEGINVVNSNCHPSDGAGTDEAVSLEVWYETPSDITGIIDILGWKDDGALSNGQLQKTSANRAAWQLITDASNLIKRTSVAIQFSASTLYHIVCTYDGSETAAGMKIYIDDTLVTTTDDSIGSYTGVPAIVTNWCFRPAMYHTGQSGNGLYQLARQFNAELTSGEVSTLYNSGTPVGLNASLRAKCVQENLLNNNANADNIGVNGTNEGGVTYQTI